MLRIHTGRRVAIAVALAAACALAGDGVARAQNSGGAVIDISKPQRAKYPIAIVKSGDGGSAATVHDVASFDLSIAGWFKVVAPDTFRHLRTGVPREQRLDPRQGVAHIGHAGGRGHQCSPRLLSTSSSVARTTTFTSCRVRSTLLSGSAFSRNCEG